MNIRTGTSGYSYAPWKGIFYPKDLPASRMLGFYAGRFPTVEVNATFYRLPTMKTVAGWSEQVDDRDFTFALKAPGRITHQRRLRDAQEPVEAFLAVARTLGPRLGPLLFQLPPSLKADLPRLEAFLTLLPRELRIAFEFRHESWFGEPVLSSLRAHGAALCLSESDELAAPRVATARFGYLRLRKADYAESDLASWASFIRAQDWTDAFVYFKHEDGAMGPRYAEQLAALT